MIAIIDGALYNTDTALKLAVYSSKARAGSAAQLRDRTWKETLFISRQGNLFLQLYGGRTTRFAVDRGDGKGKQRATFLQALTADEALQWCLKAKKQDLFAQLLDPGATEKLALEARALARIRRRKQMKNHGPKPGWREQLCQKESTNEGKDSSEGQEQDRPENTAKTSSGSG
tara:strand:+ start:1279 stop:1797 length:519 start_codon:yes stop_codon:yes gene_type:complete